MKRWCWRSTAAWVAALAMMVLPVRAIAQAEGLVTDPSVFPHHGFLVTGYGSTGYAATFLDDATPNEFSASLSPVFLFQIRDRFLFESELELEFEDGGTVVGLEYAQIGYSLTDNLSIGVGKFLLPFNVFSERLHPTWINKLASPPATYGHHGGPGPTDAMLPVLSDLGVQLRSSVDLGGFWYLTGVGFVTQGPQLEEDEHTEEPGAEPPHDVPEVAFGNAVALRARPWRRIPGGSAMRTRSGSRHTSGPWPGVGSNPERQQGGGRTGERGHPVDWPVVLTGSRQSLSRSVAFST